MTTSDDVGPTWATVYVDGELKGGTPLRLNLRAGARRLWIERAGFQTVDRVVTIRPGHASLEHIALRP